MNPCPCGYMTDTIHACTCSPAQIDRYKSRLSGPLLDRIDIHIDVPAVPFREIKKGRATETSADVRGRVTSARAVQQTRFKKLGIHANAQMTSRMINRFCPMDSDCLALLELAIARLGLSARAYNRVIKISRTIADLSGEETIRPVHVSEAIQYRSLDRKKR